MTRRTDPGELLRRIIALERQITAVKAGAEGEIQTWNVNGVLVRTAPAGEDGEVLTADSGARGLHAWQAPVHPAPVVAVMCGVSINVAASATRYFYPVPAALEGAEGDVQAVVPALWNGATISDMVVRLVNGSFSGGTHTWTVRKNGADTALEIATGDADGTGLFYDSVNSFTVATDDLLAVKAVNTNTASRRLTSVGFKVTLA